VSNIEIKRNFIKLVKAYDLYSYILSDILAPDSRWCRINIPDVKVIQMTL
jgi:hypothetical protein